MRLLTINVIRKNGKYIGALEECPEITCESDCIDDIVAKTIKSIKDYLE